MFFVRSTDAAGNTQVTQRAFTVTVPQQATPTPTPTADATADAAAGRRTRRVNALPVSGIVLVKVNGKFVPLVPSLIKNGTEVDARKGVVADHRPPRARSPASTTACSRSPRPAG